MWDGEVEAIKAFIEVGQACSLSRIVHLGRSLAHEDKDPNEVAPRRC